MKKLIASLLVLVFGATMVMAEVPTSGAESKKADMVSSADFADVEGVGLGELESEEVKGNGPVAGAVGGAIIGGVAGGIYESVKTAYRMVTKQENRTTKQIQKDIIEGMKSGAIQGTVVGAMLPSF